MRFVRALSHEERTELLRALKVWGDPSEVRRARSVRHWIDLYEAEGLEGLRTKPRSGRPPKVDEHYRQVLRTTIETPPRELGLAFNRWTLPRLGIYMDKKTGVTVSVGHMSRLLKGLGYVYKRARHDLSHKRDQKLYELRKAELEELIDLCVTNATGRGTARRARKLVRRREFGHAMACPYGFHS